MNSESSDLSLNPTAGKEARKKQCYLAALLHSKQFMRWREKMVSKRTASEQKTMKKQTWGVFSFAPLKIYKDLWHHFNKPLWHGVSYKMISYPLHSKALERMLNFNHVKGLHWSQMNVKWFRARLKVKSMLHRLIAFKARKNDNNHVSWTPS